MISRRMDHPHSRPASPVSVASLDGFSKRHSRFVFRQRLQGGLSAPSHLIFCFLHAFCHPGQGLPKSHGIYDSHKHLKSDAKGWSTTSRSFGDAHIRGTRLSVLTTGLMSLFPFLSSSSCLLTIVELPRESIRHQVK